MSAVDVGRKISERMAAERKAPQAAPSDAPATAAPPRGHSGTATGTPTQASELQRRHQGLRRHRWTAAELMGVQFPPARYAVPGVVAEGVNLLCGPPKIGKSWLALSLAVAVATGGQAFGTLDVAKGDVLYLALEDTGRRLQNRLRKVLAEKDAPEGLTLETQCPPFPEGAAHVRAWLGQHPEARLVIIDVLARVRGASSTTSAYSDDYAAVGQVKRIADEHGIAVILVHHTRKAAAEDFLDTVSGTAGIAGAADAVLVLGRGRGEADGVLHVTGRDIEEAEHALSFDAATGQWSIMPGPALDNLISGTRRALLDHVRAHPGQQPKSITGATGLPYASVKKTLARMAEDGQLIRDKRGRYSPVPAVPDVSAAAQSGSGSVSGDVSECPQGVSGERVGDRPC